MNQIFKPAGSIKPCEKAGNKKHAACPTRSNVVNKAPALFVLSGAFFGGKNMMRRFGSRIAVVINKPINENPMKASRNSNFNFSHTRQKQTAVKVPSCHFD
jgi:hypothetical protein